MLVAGHFMLVSSYIFLDMDACVFLPHFSKCEYYVIGFSGIFNILFVPPTRCRAARPSHAVIISTFIEIGSTRCCKIIVILICPARSLLYVIWLILSPGTNPSPSIHSFLSCVEKFHTHNHRFVGVKRSGTYY